MRRRHDLRDRAVAGGGARYGGGDRHDRRAAGLADADVVPGAAASVTISSPTATPQAGTTVQLTAVVRDRYGNLVPGATVGWSTSDARIATVSASACCWP